MQGQRRLLRVKGSRHRRPWLIAAMFALAFAAPRPANSADAGDVLARSRAMYASLRSYADTGVILEEYGPSSKDKHTFTTYFNRNPRAFYFDFKKNAGDRYVIWGDPEAFHTWWKTTAVKEDYPNPNNLGAFTMAGPQTYGSATKIPPLLYPKAPLHGSFEHFDDPVLDSTEDFGGRRCYRLLGSAHDVYGKTGHEANVRQLTVWIDAESFLIRKVVEQRKAPPGQISRTTTTFEPQANPALDDSRFKFVPPEPK
jgi:hypothetical protein